MRPLSATEFLVKVVDEGQPKELNEAIAELAMRGEVEINEDDEGKIVISLAKGEKQLAR